MRKGTPSIASSKRLLDMLEMVIADGGQSNVTALAVASQIPVATVHRQVKTLVEEGYLRAFARGRYVAGARLLALAERIDEKSIIATSAAPTLSTLANKVHGVVQLGTLENEMVTYRLKTGKGAQNLFTRVGMQLEAYCSGIGKVLLANVSEEDLHSYLAGGPFVPLTPHTIVDPQALSEELDRVRIKGYAVDNEEVSEGLVCVAAPIRNKRGEVIAAISVSQAKGSTRWIAPAELSALVLAAAAEIEANSTI